MLRVRITPEAMVALFTTMHEIDFVSVAEGLPDGAILHSIGISEVAAGHEVIDIYFEHPSSPDLEKFKDVKVSFKKFRRECDA